MNGNVVTVFLLFALIFSVILNLALYRKWKGK